MKCFLQKGEKNLRREQKIHYSLTYTHTNIHTSLLLRLDCGYMFKISMLFFLVFFSFHRMPKLEKTLQLRDGTVGTTS